MNPVINQPYFKKKPATFNDKHFNKDYSILECLSF